MTFLIQGKNLFLTYPRCPLSKEQLLEALTNLNLNFKYYLISIENHVLESSDSSCGTHLHVILGWESRFTTRVQSKFDVLGFHPNLQSVRRLGQCIAYVKKDSDWIESTPAFFSDSPQGGGGDGKEPGLSDLVQSSVSKEEFLERVLHSNTLCRYWSQALGIANYRWEHSVQPYTSIYTHFPNLPLLLLSWATGNIGQEVDRPRSLVVWSRGTGLGKTEWARSLGRHMYWCGQKDLSRWDVLGAYLVMDDIEWQFVPDKKQFFGSQKEFTLTDKYKGKKTVKWGKPLIFLCNYDPLEQEGWNDWYNQRCLIVELKNKLY